MLSRLFSRSTAIRRNSFDYRPTRFFATRSSFPCIVCLFRVSHFWGSVQTCRSFNLSLEAQSGSNFRFADEALTNRPDWGLIKYRNVDLIKGT